MSYTKAKEAMEDTDLTDNEYRMHEALLEYVKEIEDRLQSTLEVNHLWDGS